jgi:hypothetical protein
MPCQGHILLYLGYVKLCGSQLKMDPGVCKRNSVVHSSLSI